MAGSLRIPVTSSWSSRLAAPAPFPRSTHVRSCRGERRRLPAPYRCKGKYCSRVWAGWCKLNHHERTRATFCSGARAFGCERLQGSCCVRRPCSKSSFVTTPERRLQAARPNRAAFARCPCRSVRPALGSSSQVWARDEGTGSPPWHVPRVLFHTALSKGLSAGCPPPRLTSQPGCGSGRVPGQLGKLQMSPILILDVFVSRQQHRLSTAAAPGPLVSPWLGWAPLSLPRRGLRDPPAAA